MHHHQNHLHTTSSTCTNRTNCSIDITREGPLVEFHAMKNSSFMDCRFEKPGISKPGIDPALRLSGECRNIRLLGCYFSNTPKHLGRRPPLIDAPDCSDLSLLSNSFPASSPIFSVEPDYRARLNVNLADR